MVHFLYCLLQSFIFIFSLIFLVYSYLLIILVLKHHLNLFLLLIFFYNSINQIIVYKLDNLGFLYTKNQYKLDEINDDIVLLLPYQLLIFLINIQNIFVKVYLLSMRLLMAYIVQNVVYHQFIFIFKLFTLKLVFFLYYKYRIL